MAGVVNVTESRLIWEKSFGYTCGGIIYITLFKVGRLILTLDRLD